MALLDRLGRFDAVHDRHVHVHEDDVGTELVHSLDRLGAVGSLPHDLKLVPQFDELSEAAPDGGVVVDQQDLQRTPHFEPIRSRFTRQLSAGSARG
jgi:hypothetical protein